MLIEYVGYRVNTNYRIFGALPRIVAHVPNEYSTMDWIMEQMIERSGLSILTKDYRDGFIGSYFCIR
jgi:hypothetical protein